LIVTEILEMRAEKGGTAYNDGVSLAAVMGMRLIRPNVGDLWPGGGSNTRGGNRGVQKCSTSGSFGTGGLEWPLGLVVVAKKGEVLGVSSSSA